MIDLGTVKPGSTLRIPFSTFDKDDGSSITMTAFAVGDILVYKDGSTTERASTSGYTATTDFDAKTGKQLAIIDLSDNTTADFFQSGSEYLVAVDAVTVDAVTTGGWIARFRIGYTGAVLDTWLATLASQTSFTLNSGPAEDDALNGMWAVIHDAASAVQQAWVLISDYTGSTKTVTLAAVPAPTFTIAAKDNISVMFPAPLQPTTLGRTVVVDAAGLVDANAVKVGPTGAGTAQTAGDIMADTNDIQARLPAVLVSGRMDSSVGAMAANVVTAAAVADGAIDAATFAAGAIDAAAIAANAIGASELADGAIDAATFAAGAIDAAAIADSAIDRATFAVDTGLRSARSNTAQAGGATSITLDAGASAVTDFHKWQLVYLTGGTGAGQARLVTAYNGATKVATVEPAWATNPDVTSTFALLVLPAFARDAILGTPAAASIAADLVVIDDFVDALETRIPATIPELAAVVPVTPTFIEALAWLVMISRNKADLVTATGVGKVYNDAGAAIAQATHTDSGDYNRTKYA